MPRYIDANALIEEMTINALPNDAQHLYLAMRGMVRNAPTADVESVVRCKECEFARCDGEALVINCIHANGLYMPAPYDFCSYGKKKGGDE